MQEDLSTKKDDLSKGKGKFEHERKVKHKKKEDLSRKVRYKHIERK